MLKEQMAHTPKVHVLFGAKFNNYVPSSTRSQTLPFYYQRFLENLDSAVTDMNGSFRFISDISGRGYVQVMTDHNKRRP